MDSQTQQFAYRAFIATVCAFAGLMAIYMCLVGLLQGDGEAVRIIDTLYPLLHDTLIAMVSMVIAPHAISTVTSLISSNVAAAAAGKHSEKGSGTA